MDQKNLEDRLERDLRRRMRQIKTLVGLIRRNFTERELLERVQISMNYLDRLYEFYAQFPKD